MLTEIYSQNNVIVQTNKARTTAIAIPDTAEFIQFVFGIDRLETNSFPVQAGNGVAGAIELVGTPNFPLCGLGPIVAAPEYLDRAGNSFPFFILGCGSIPAGPNREVEVTWQATEQNVNIDVSLFAGTA